MNKILMILTILNTAMFSCKSTKKTTSADATTTVAASTTAENANLYRLSVSFYSIGGGTDSEAIQKLNHFLTSYKPTIANETSRWGREGEVNYCFRLSELSKKDQVKFIEEVKKLLASSQLVRIEENKECIVKKR